MPSPAAIQRIRKDNKFLAVNAPPHLRTPPYANPHSATNTPKGRVPYHPCGIEPTASVMAVEKLLGGGPKTVRKAITAPVPTESPTVMNGSPVWRNVSSYRLPDTDRVISRTEAILKATYEFQRLLGSGNWAKVHEVACPDGVVRAVKVAPRPRPGPDQYVAQQRFDRLEGEFTTLDTIPPQAAWNPNVIKFERLIKTEERSCLFMPLYDQQMKVCLPTSHCRVYYEKLAEAVLWLHQNFITHNDIKLANIVIDRSRDPELGEPVIIDFGFATSHKDKQWKEDCFRSKERWGTTEYLSPERALGLDHDERLSDVWALGITFFEMATGQTPFEREGELFNNEQSKQEYLRRTMEDEWHVDEYVPHYLEQLCKSMIVAYAPHRAYLTKVLTHPFFTSHDSAEYPSDIENQPWADDSFRTTEEGHGAESIPETQGDRRYPFPTGETGAEDERTMQHAKPADLRNAHRSPLQAGSNKGTQDVRNAHLPSASPFRSPARPVRPTGVPPPSFAVHSPQASPRRPLPGSPRYRALHNVTSRGNAALQASARANEASPDLARGKGLAQPSPRPPVWDAQAVPAAMTSPATERDWLPRRSARFSDTFADFPRGWSQSPAAGLQGPSGSRIPLPSRFVSSPVRGISYRRGDSSEVIEELKQRGSIVEHSSPATPAEAGVAEYDQDSPAAFQNASYTKPSAEQSFFLSDDEVDLSVNDDLIADESYGEEPADMTPEEAVPDNRHTDDSTLFEDTTDQECDDLDEVDGESEDDEEDPTVVQGREPSPVFSTERHDLSAIFEACEPQSPSAQRDDAARSHRSSRRTNRSAQSSHPPSRAFVDEVERAVQSIKADAQRRMLDGQRMMAEAQRMLADAAKLEALIELERARALSSTDILAVEGGASSAQAAQSESEPGPACAVETAPGATGPACESQSSHGIRDVNVQGEYDADGEDEQELDDESIRSVELPSSSMGPEDASGTEPSDGADEPQTPGSPARDAAGDEGDGASPNIYLTPGPYPFTPGAFKLGQRSTESIRPLGKGLAYNAPPTPQAVEVLSASDKENASPTALATPGSKLKRGLSSLRGRMTPTSPWEKAASPFAEKSGNVLPMHVHGRSKSVTGMSLFGVKSPSASLSRSEVSTPSAAASATDSATESFAEQGKDHVGQSPGPGPAPRRAPSAWESPRSGYHTRSWSAQVQLQQRQQQQHKEPHGQGANKENAPLTPALTPKSGPLRRLLKGAGATR